MKPVVGFILDTSNIPKKTNSISSESVYSSFNRVQQAKALDKSFIDYETELVLDGTLTHSEVSNHSENIDKRLPKERRLFKHR